MKLTIMGASGLIGSKAVDLLTAAGHQVVAASRATGVDVLTGDGLADALDGAEVLVDVTNSPSFEDDPVLQFFTTSATNLTAAAKTAGVGHYVALSIVGVDELPDSGYMRAKVAQEQLISASGLPYSIVRATQFEEFTGAIVSGLTDGDTVWVPDALIQPIAANDVAAEVVRVALGKPLNRFEDIGGPEQLSFAELARRKAPDKSVIVDPAATYFGTALAETSLVVTD
ncbi:MULTISPECIES: SDR family oxidoreductase [unclassified Mycobacterium]|uniref:SDR family oxidoreductase n=1 Tax=unclassified Mycobacterium TaxID=2642494 RepID=UPI0029C68F30|nr:MULTISPECIES: SDR family oxidoreductase [unclassified Mycobacterium]